MIDNRENFKPALPSESKINRAISPIPEPLSGRQTSELVSHLYRLSGPRLGARLVEANVVLTLAGTRGQTELYIPHPTQDDRPKLDQLSAFLRPRGVILTDFTEEAVKSGAGYREDTLYIDIESLRGYERVSRLSDLPGVEPFNAATSEEGLFAWKKKLYGNLEEAQRNKLLPHYQEAVDIFYAGVVKGYPDQAVYDFSDWFETGQENKLRNSDLGELKYDGALPTFSYYAEHQSDPQIQQTQEVWNRILRDFYNSEWHTMIKDDKAFQIERENIEI